MEKFLIGALVILFFCSPIILLVVLILFIRGRKKREALGISKKIDYSYRNLIEPFTFSDNWLTCTIFFTLAVAYLCELIFAVEGAGKSLTPSLATLLALGGVSRNTVLHGEWYRLFTAPFLHGGLLHLLFNGIALFYAGRILEKQLGRLWFLAVYFIGGLGGSLLSVAMHEDNILSVGASGAIMGLFAAVMAVSFHASNRDKRQSLRYFSLRIIIPSLLPHASQTGMHIDYAAHFGGLIGGGLCAIIMLMSWPEDSLPRLRGFAVVITILGIIATGLSFFMVAHHYTEFQILGNCLTTMRETAQKAGADPATYMKDNAAWLQTCVKYYLDNLHR